MKKFLSLILAILMIVSTVPMAFAAEFDKDAYTKALIDAYSAAYNIYAPDENSTSSQKTIDNLFYLGAVELAIFEEYPALEGATLDVEKLATMPEAANVYMEALEEAALHIKGRMTSVQVNSKGLMAAMYGTLLKHGEATVSDFTNKLSAELTEKATTSTINATSILFAKDSHNYTQADFDSVAMDSIMYYTQIDNCLSGRHNILTDPATDNGDGTHTFTCAFCTEIATVEHKYTDGKCICGANEPVIDDGKDDVTDDKTETEDKTDTDNDTIEPEKTNFIKQLLQKISDFFKNLFEQIRNLFKM